MLINRIHRINCKNYNKNKRITRRKNDKKYIDRHRYDGPAIDDKIKA